MYGLKYDYDLKSIPVVKAVIHDNTQGDIIFNSFILFVIYYEIYKKLYLFIYLF